MSTPAGWYDDGSGRQRWWDGTQWTEHYAPPSQANDARYPASDSAAAASTARSTPILGFIGLALAALGTILACVPTTAVFIIGAIVLLAAFVVSLIAVFKKNTARWPAIVGIILSVVGGVVGAIVLVLALLTSAASSLPAPAQPTSVVSETPPAAGDSGRPDAATIAEVFETRLHDGGITEYDTPGFYACVGRELYESDLKDEELQRLLAMEGAKIFKDFADATVTCTPETVTTVDGGIHGNGKQVSLGSGITVQITMRADRFSEPEPWPGKPLTQDDYDQQWGDATRSDGQIAVVTVTVRNSGEKTQSDNGAFFTLRSSSGETIPEAGGLKSVLEHPSDPFDISDTAPGEETTYTLVYPLRPAEMKDTEVDLLLIRDMGLGKSFLIQ
ncbi:MAG: DUF2510 domain-containing protein [Microbacterium sp.]